MKNDFLSFTFCKRNFFGNLISDVSLDIHNVDCIGELDFPIMGIFKSGPFCGRDIQTIYIIHAL